jgi:hypothetical protein
LASPPFWLQPAARSASGATARARVFMLIALPHLF